jgi:hypothetical protein
LGPSDQPLGMERLEQEERKKIRRRSLRRAGAGLLLFAAGMVLGGLARSGLSSFIWVTAGFLALIGCGRRALLLWNIDALVFEDSPELPLEARRSRPPARPRRSFGVRSGAFRLLALAGIGLLPAISGPAHRTIFEVPDAPVQEDSRTNGLAIEAGLPVGEG